MGGGGIFISYRRSDAPGDARSIHDRLAAKFGKSMLFMDVDNLFAGQRFDRELHKALTDCELLVVIIGQRWMELLGEQARSADRDYVREEIAGALARDIAVIPVLVGAEGNMPKLPHAEDLPEDIKNLVLYQKHSVTHESFGRNIDDLIVAISHIVRKRRGAGPRKSLLVTAAIGLLLLLGGLVAWLSAPWSVGASIGSKKDPTTQADTEQARQRAEQEAKKTAEEDMAAHLVTECDRLAGSPYDPTRPSGVVGVNFTKINAQLASAACDEALGKYPKIARLTFQAGRAAEARKDYANAIRLYRAAIDQGSVAAMGNLGEMYLKDPRGVPPNFAEAYTWYAKAAARGSALAMERLGFIQESRAPADFAGARDWYKKAADLGYPDAMIGLGVLYQRGMGGDPDLKGAQRLYEEARKSYQKDADLGDVSAMSALGRIYEEGLGVPKDRAQARKWYQLAANAGDLEARAKLQKLR